MSQPQILMTDVGYSSLDVTDSEFALFRDLIKSHCGINLSPAKRGMVRTRLSRRVVSLECTSYYDYYRVCLADADEFTRMVDLITTNKTEFFRDPDQFALLASLFEKWRDQPCIRIASLGCSTGEEPYTIAMVGAEVFGDRLQSKLEVHALDLCTEVLGKAAQGVFEDFRVADLSDDQLETYFLRGCGANEGKVQIAPELRSIVHFRQHNLLEPLPFTAKFDAIFCRNVSIYFDQELQQELYRRIYGALRPKGLFFMGSSESLVGAQLPFSHLQASVYRRRGR